MPSFRRYAVGILALLLGVGLISDSSGSDSANPDLSIQGYGLERFARVSRRVFEYTLTASVRNDGPVARNARAELSISAPGISVLDGNVAFGDVGAGETLGSCDAFTIRHDRAFPFTASDIQWLVLSADSNSVPSADAGPDQVVAPGSDVVLDGSSSSDADGDLLSFGWSAVSVPTGSQASLSSETAIRPGFQVDFPGEYVFELTVDDGQLESSPAQVVVTTGNAAPTADAGPDQTVAAGVATLDGSGSFDPNGDALTFDWQLVSVPPGSAASLSNGAAVSPTFNVDRAGRYVAQLVVDDGLLPSFIDEVIIDTDQSPPIAVADSAQSALVGELVGLDGSNSYDPDGEPVSYRWALVARPESSSAALADADTAFPTLLPDVPGVYVAQLVVSDGCLESVPSTVVVLVQNPVPTDSDGDGLSDAEELALGTNPNNPDTDGDGLEDGDEVLTFGTSPLLADTDGDSFRDDEELAQGSDPTIGTSTPVGTLPPDLATIATPTVPTEPTTVAGSTAFLYTGPNPPQTGVAPDTIEPVRAAVVRGRVLSGGSGLPAVAVAVLGHPEFGRTLTGLDGTFALAVNGGGLLTIDYTRDGYLSAQRQVDVPWQDFVVAEDVVMLQPDPVVTIVNLDAAVDMQVAQGSPVVDADGSRQATVLFPVGTQATMTLPDGTTQPMPTLSVRATEYTIGAEGPARMPAPLPPTSAYTYAVELNADEALAAGATTVSFSQPLPFYVDNFLNFPVGIKVPTAYYDRDKAAWVPVPDGQVIQILSVAGGSATVDYTGDGLPDDGTAIGLTGEERARLAELYPQDKTLWRVAISHFTPYDLNWYERRSDDSEEPKNDPPEEVDDDADLENCPCCSEEGNSVIDCPSQLLREEISVVGAPFSLNYASDRSPGFIAARTVRIPISGASVPDSLRRISLDVAVAGRTFTYQYAPAPNLVQDFTWDGLDAFDREVFGRAPATIEVTYVYDAVYGLPPDLAASFAAANGVPIPGDIIVRDASKLKQTNMVVLGTPIGAPVGGWTPSIHHSYEFSTSTLFRGDGIRSNLRVKERRPITTVAGNGGEFFELDDDIPAIYSAINSLVDVGTDAEGNLYIAERGDFFQGEGGRVRRVGPDGNITTVAGNGTIEVTGDGGPATEAGLASVSALDLGPDGSLYISTEGRVDGTFRNFIRRVDPSGTITTVAGGGSVLGEGVPATEAALPFVPHLAVGSDGTLYLFAGYGGLLRVGPDGILSTVVANSDDCGELGDGGPASEANFCQPAGGIALGPDGSVYIGDDENLRIRRVSPDGIMSTVAGNGTFGFSGDGGPATAAAIQYTAGLAVGPDGSVYFGDSDRIRRVDPSGIITSIAGNGTRGFSGDGGPATSASIGSVASVALAVDGSLYIAEGFQSNRVRRVSPLRSIVPGVDLEVPSGDGSEVYFFDASGRHLATINALTDAVKYQFAYDAAGLLIDITDGDGNVTTIERDGFGEPTAIVAPDGQRTTIELNADGYLATVANPGGEEVAIGYGNGGLMASFRKPAGNQSDYTYDPLGRLLTAANPDGSGQTLAVSDDIPNQSTATRTTALGRTTSYVLDTPTTGGTRRTTISPDGTSTTIDFATDGIVTTTNPDGTVTTRVDGPDPRFGMQAPYSTSVTTVQGSLTALQEASRAVEYADPDDDPTEPLLTISESTTRNGRTSTSVYTADTRTEVTTSPAGRTTTSVVDEQGRITLVQVPGIAPNASSYDLRGRVQSSTLGTGVDSRTTTFAYGLDGFLQSITDPSGRSTDFAHDVNGRVTRQTLPGSRQIDFGYDTNGNLNSVTPPGRPAHTFTYNAADLTATYSPPTVTGGGSTAYAYNTDRQIELITRPDGRTQAYDYDAAGKLRTLSILRGQYGYEYSATTGQRTGVTDPQGGALAFQYLGSLLTQVTRSGDVAGSVEFQYDNDFRVVTTTVNDTNPVAFGYDPDSLLTSAGSLALQYDSANDLLMSTTLDSFTDTYAYSAFGEPMQYSASSAGTSIYLVSYVRDSLGRITQKEETVSGVVTTWDYSYDSAGRLEQVRRNGAVSATFSYDLNGNRLSKMGPGVSESGTYDDQDRLLTYGGASYTYAANGEARTKNLGGQTTTYDYDELSNLISVSLPDGTLIEYVVDGQNRRVGRRMNGTLVQGFLYEDELRPIAELDGAGAIVSRFVYGTKVNVPDYMTRDGVTYRFIHDQLGSPRFVVDATTGVIAQELEYDEFGNVLVNTNPGFQPFGYAGGLYDIDTALVRFGARDYDAQTGRWTAKDPLGFEALDTNLYVYVGNDPINFNDPSGEISPVSGLSCAVAFATGAVFDAVSTLLDQVEDASQFQSELEKLNIQIEACDNDSATIELEQRKERLAARFQSKSLQNLLSVFTPGYGAAAAATVCSYLIFF